MLYLPPCLGSLSALAARENPRYAVTCLRVFEYAEDRYRIEATDGQRLLIVRGQGATDAPFGQPLEDSAHAGLIPAESWRDGFKKLFKKRPGQNPLPIGLSLSTTAFRFSNHCEELNGGQPDERADDQADTNGQFSEDDHVAEPARAVGIDQVLQEAPVPVKGDDRRARRRGAQGAFPEAHDARTRPVHPGWAGELVPTGNHKVVADIHTDGQP